MNKQNPVWKRVTEYLMITLGCAIYAVSFNCFFQPNHLSMGGFTGVAQIINHFIPIFPVGVTIFVLNVPLMIIGVKKMGWKLLTSTLFAIAVSSLMIDGMNLLYMFPAMDPLLASIYGGVLLGISMGLLMKVSATTGGTELLARLLKFKLPHLSIGKLCMVIDVTVILLYALTFHNLNNALYGIVAMYISSIAMDTIVYGSTGAKLAYIISNHGPEIVEKLLKMDLGVTVLHGQGAFTGDEKKVALCAFKRSQIAAIKAAVTALDPDAFIIVCEAHEVLGEGFGAYSPDDL